MTLPPLPVPRYPAARVGLNNEHRVWTVEEMKDYATAAVQAALSKCGGDNCMGRRLDGNTNWVTEDALKAAVLAEREACAKQLDALGNDHCAAAIRARKD